MAAIHITALRKILNSVLLLIFAFGRKKEKFNITAIAFLFVMIFTVVPDVSNYSIAEK